MAESSQQPLIAMLALMIGLVPRNVVQAALNRWSANAELDLAQSLKEGGWLDDAQVASLRCLAAAHLAKHAGNLQASLDAWNANALTQQFPTTLEQTAIDTSADTLSQNLQTTIEGKAPTAQDPLPPRDTPSYTHDQRFIRLKLHARGGIGDVFLARDRELQRNVALKEIQQRFVDRADQRQRFLLEAEITGNLEHPGIVPVYSLGKSADGKPFYAMRFIQGESLAEAIKRFFKGRTQAASGKSDQTGYLWGVEFQQLLRRFLDVCDAIEYAHSRNVIHRDLKPGNIMLGQYGETLVVDWGLAKIVGHSDIVYEDVHHTGGTDDFDPETVAMGMTASLQGNTQPGTTVGTPAYMSPEQARGANEDLGPTSDVYSLGATLYELLTGSPPFSGKTVPEILSQVKEGKLKPPRELQPTLPAPLQAICLKAMAYQPAARYPSARELARDLEHWIADEPVTAHPDQDLERAARWLRRHRTLTYGFATTLAGIALVSILALFVLNDARRREATARAEAETNFNTALDAVDHFLTNVSENRLLKEQETVDLRNLRRDLLESALPFYRNFVLQRSEDPRLQQQLANAYVRLGEISLLIGSAQQAQDYFDSAHKLWEELARTNPDSLEARIRLADCDVAIGKLAGSKSLPESLAWLKKALELYELVVGQRQSDPRSEAKLASCCSDIAVCLSKSKEVDSSLTYLEKARTILQKLVQADSSNLDLKKDLAAIVNRMGHAEYARNRYPDAQQHFEAYRALCNEMLLAAPPGPKPLQLQDMLARSYFNIATTHRERRNDRECLDALREAIKSWTALVGIAPSVTSYQIDLADALFETALTEHRLGNDTASLKSLDEALAYFDRLIKDDRTNLNYQVSKARALNQKGVFYDEARDNAKARQTFEEAVALMREIDHQSNGIEERVVLLCQMLENLGEVLVDGGDVAKGLPLYRESIDRLQALSQAHPTDRVYAISLASSWVVVGNLLRLQADPTSALDSFEHAGSILEPLMTANPHDAELQGAWCEVLERQAAALIDLNRTEQAIPLLHQAEEFAQRSLDAGSDGQKLRQVYSEVLWQLADLGRKTSDSAARTLDEKRLALWNSRPPADLIELAIRQATRADLIGYGKTPLPRAGERVREGDRQQAVESVQLAIERGFKDLDRLRSNPYLAPLLDREPIKR